MTTAARQLEGSVSASNALDRPPGAAARPASTSLRFVDALPDLAAIFEPDVNGVVLCRERSPTLEGEAQSAAAQVGYRRLFTVPAENGQRIAAAALPDAPHLAADIRRWAELLGELTGAACAGVRVARLEAPMCRRFHVDRVTLRLVITYQGRGTELLASEHVDRSRLGHAARGAADEVSGLLLVPDGIRAARPFDVVLLKGESWPGNSGRGAVHRSPSASVAAPRLVVTLDPL